MKRTKNSKALKDKCTGCGHRLSQHRTYARGTNRHGCHLVCIVDGCRFWNECREPTRKKGQAA